MRARAAVGRRGGDRAAWSWALYDWANSAFATTVMAGFFPVFFKEYWNAGVAVTESTFRLGVANSAASLAVAVAAPILGAVADAGGHRKRFLVIFAALGIGSTAALAGVGQGEWVLAASLYLTGTVGFMAANVFYDALLPAVAPPGRAHRVSAMGYAFGYLGGGLLFSLNVAMTLWPGAFGLSGPAQAVRLSFVTVAVWWALFSIPLVRWVPEGGGETVPRAGREGLRRLLGTLRALGEHRQVFGFLLAYWLYIDGVDTIVRMAVDYGMSIGLEPRHLIAALLLTQFVGFPAALVYGRIGERVGAKRAVLAGLAVYLGVTLWARHMQTPAEFFGLAVVIGLVQGGVQALSRSLYSHLVPAGRSAEFFGFYNLTGKFAAVLGPVLMGGVAVLTGNPRDSVLAVGVLIVAGGLLLLRVPGGR